MKKKSFQYRKHRKMIKRELEEMRAKQYDSSLNINFNLVI